MFKRFCESGVANCNVCCPRSVPLPKLFLQFLGSILVSPKAYRTCSVFWTRRYWSVFGKLLLTYALGRRLFLCDNEAFMFERKRVCESKFPAIGHFRYAESFKLFQAPPPCLKIKPARRAGRRRNTTLGGCPRNGRASVASGPTAPTGSSSRKWKKCARRSWKSPRSRTWSKSGPATSCVSRTFALAVVASSRYFGRAMSIVTSYHQPFVFQNKSDTT